MQEKTGQTVTDLGAGYRDGSLTPSEVLDACLREIQRLNPQLNAFTALDGAAAEAARESDVRHQAGTPIGPLDGIPIAIKDNLLVRGLPATWGSRVFADFVPERDELPIAALRKAGAVIVGKTNVSEFTLGGYTDNPVYGVTRNPYDLALTPGGSSGGVAAAVASGMVPLGIGTDGGGSARRPAAHTGLVGFKPSVGRIPRGSGFPRLMHDFEVIGPLTKTVADLALVLEVLAAPNRKDEASRRFPRWRGAEIQLPALRILAVEQFGEAPIDPRIRESFRASVGDLAALGHHVETGELPFDIGGAGAWSQAFSGIGLATIAAGSPDFNRLASQPFVDLARAGGQMTGIGTMEVMDAVRDFRASVALAFQSIDIIATPTTAAQPWPVENEFPATIDGKVAGPRGHAVFTGWVNAAGHPAISVPIEPDQSGMPIGLQLVGDIGFDERVVGLALALEQVR